MAAPSAILRFGAQVVFGAMQALAKLTNRANDSLARHGHVTKVEPKPPAK